MQPNDVPGTPLTVPGRESMASPADKPSPVASRIVRRVHMYLALFVMPWMLMYALSTLVMNHHQFVLSFYSGKQPAMVKERELDYTRAFPDDATPAVMARQILADIGLEGTHRVTGGKNGKPLVIDRQHSWAPRRITFHPESGKLAIERQEFRGQTFLERMHRRRGYQQDYVRDDTWAFSVDLAVLAMIFWGLSGLWLWWELRTTRVWGACCVGLGLLSFTLFVMLL